MQSTIAQRENTIRSCQTPQKWSYRVELEGTSLNINYYQVKDMMRTLAVVILIVGVVCSKQDSQRRVAKLDEIDISLAFNQTKTIIQDIDQQQTLAFMVNP